MTVDASFALEVAGPAGYVEQMLDDLTGRRFGKLCVVQREVSTASRMTRWLVRCDCGRSAVVLGGNLRSGRTKGCGCTRTKHGMYRSPEYFVWNSMVQRCENRRHHSYANYGGRGITVDPEWRRNFSAFLRDMGARPKGAPRQFSIERRDNGKGYSKDNCYWATAGEQHINRRNNHILTVNGTAHPLSVWARIAGLSWHALAKRLENGWSPERAVSTPVEPRRPQRRRR